MKKQINRCRRMLCLLAALLGSPVPGTAAGAGADWHDLWLPYPPVADEVLQLGYRLRATEVVVQGAMPIADSMRDELRRGLSGLLAMETPVAANVTRDGAVVAGCPKTSPLIAGLGWEDELASLGEEGFIIRSTVVDGRPLTVIAGGGERGALYGVFRYLRHLQLHGKASDLAIKDQPRNKLRLLNHWDNWPGTREE